MPGAAPKSKKRVSAAGEEGRGLVSVEPPRPLLQSPEDPGTHYDRAPEFASIARDIGGLTEMIEQSQGGLLYHNDEELLAAIQRLHTNPELRREMGDRAYRAFTERWTENVHMEAYFRVLEDTARRKLGFVPWEQPVRRPLQFPAATVV